MANTNPSRAQMIEWARAGALLEVDKARAEAKAATHEINVKLLETLERIQRFLKRFTSAQTTSQQSTKQAYKMSAEARKAISVRMKKYWAARRKANARKNKKK